MPKTTTIDRIKGTYVVPKSFSIFFKTMKLDYDVENRQTVTVFLDDNGMLASLMKQGTNNDRMNLVLNKSRGWSPQKNYKRLTFEPWHSGDVRVLVDSDEKAIKQAVKLCNEWSKAKPFYRPTVTVKGEKRKYN